MSDLTRDDVIDMLQGIFEEQRELSNEEMQAYKDMLHRKENDMAFIKATESRFNQTVQKDQATLIAELISRVTSLEETVEFILEHSSITEQTEVCDECIYVKGSQWCDKCNGIPTRLV